MSQGGKREGSGRKKGGANLKTRKIADQAILDGDTPLEYMLNVMRDVNADIERRDEMARAAAPFIHPRLQSTTVKGPGNNGEIIFKWQQ